MHACYCWFYEQDVCFTAKLFKLEPMEVKVATSHDCKDKSVMMYERGTSEDVAWD